MLRNQSNTLARRAQKDLFSYTIMLKHSSRPKQAKSVSWLEPLMWHSTNHIKLHSFLYMASFRFTSYTVLVWRVEISGMWHVQFNRYVLLTFCWPCILMYHNNVTNLIHFHLSQSLYCVVILYMFRVSSFRLRRHYTSSFWCELRAILAVGWLQVVGRQG
jgi:hypothetical protein